MRKQELIHVHGLLAEVAEYCEEEQMADIDLEEYRELGTYPTSIQLSKGEHKEAVFSLLHGITGSLTQETETVEGIPASAD